MINTQLKLEGKIPKVQVVEFTRNHTKFIIKFQGQFYLEGQSQGHQFSNPSETFRCLKNISSWKIKFEAVECLTVKIKILEV